MKNHPTDLRVICPSKQRQEGGLTLHDWYTATNSFLSKLAHPTAGLVLGIMHQEEALRTPQAMLTTTGLYFGGQCVIVLEEITAAIINS
jgi:hypothetical protein